jgi:hypothetical protein
MAAHGLTILRQVEHICVEKPEKAGDYAFGATYAPGTDLATGFRWDAWHLLDRARSMTPEALLAAVREEIVLHQWMSKYRTLEEVKAARDAFVRYGKPHWRKRQERFDAGQV